MKRFTRMLVAVDTRLDAHPIAQLAAEIAQHNDSFVTLVDAMPSTSWLARLAVDDLDRLRDGTRETIHRRLEEIAQPLREAGLTVESRVLDGRAWVSIIREVERGEHDLVLAVSKGDNSNYGGFFGQTARRLLRNCPVPVWLMPPHGAARIRHVVACVDTYSQDGRDAELNERIYRLASFISRYSDARLSILHAWEMSDEGLLATRISSTTIKHYAERHLAYRQELLDRFLRPYGSSSDDDNVYLIKKPPADAVAGFCTDNAVDLVVMGTVARSGLAGMIMGNTAEAVLDKLETGVLAIKPFSFKPPTV